MSQVLSLKITANFDEACSEFRKEAGIADTDSHGYSYCGEFMVFYDSAAMKIRCEGDHPDSVFSALKKTQERYGGTLFYEGEEWDGDSAETVTEAGRWDKVWIAFAIAFFPITLIYLLLRTLIWLPYKIWKETR